MRELQGDAIVAYEGTRFCPLEPGLVTATLVGVHDDDDLGCEVATYRCSNGHTWQQPTLGFILRSIAYGEQWRLLRDRLASR